MPAAGEATRLSSGQLQDELQARIDQIGFGGYQVLTLLCTGGVMMSEGAEMLIMGSITEMLEKDWSLGSFAKAFMVSVVFFGFALGNLLSGAIGDRFGRRLTILLSYLIIGVCGFLTSLARNPVVMVLLRFSVGLGCGLGFPSIYTLIPEVCPTHLRGTVCACMIGFMPLGEMFASIGVLFIDKELAGLHSMKHPLPLPDASWRRLCQFSAAPSFVFLGACLFYLQESPFFLASQGRLDEMNGVLAEMAACNGKAVEDIAVGAHSSTPLSSTGSKGPPRTSPGARGFTWWGAVGQVLGPAYWSTTAVLFVAHFTKDFSVFGLNYVFPQYFTQMSSPMSVGSQMLIISVIALPGVLVAVVITRSRRIGNISSLSLTAFLCGFLALGLLHQSPVWMHSICACLVKFMALAFFIITVVYTAEVFPTAIRNSAVGMCTCCGRAGSVMAPLAFEFSRGFDVFWFMLISFTWTVAMLAPMCLTKETKGRPLGDDEERCAEQSYGAAGRKDSMA